MTILRSALYMPGINQKAMDKALKLDCDAVILDLEDAVEASKKAVSYTHLTLPTNREV